MNIQEINWTTVIAAASGALITASLSKWADFYFNKANYKRDYYKKIIDKRLSAYESIFVMVNRILEGCQIIDNVKIQTDLLTAEGVDQIYETIFSVKEHQLWFSDEVNLALIEFAIEYEKMRSDFKIVPNSSAATCYPFAKNSLTLLERHLPKIVLKATIDLKKLHQVEPFLNRQINDLSKEVFKKKK